MASNFEYQLITSKPQDIMEEEQKNQGNTTAEKFIEQQNASAPQTEAQPAPSGTASQAPTPVSPIVDTGSTPQTVSQPVPIQSPPQEINNPNLAATPAPPLGVTPLPSQPITPPASPLQTGGNPASIPPSQNPTQNNT